MVQEEILILTEEDKIRILNSVRILMSIDKKFIKHLEKLVQLANKMPQKYFTTIQMLNWLIP